MVRRLRELLVLLVVAGALTSFVVGQGWLGLLLVVIALFLGRRLIRHGRIIGVDQRAADQERPPLLRPRG